MRRLDGPASAQPGADLWRPPALASIPAVVLPTGSADAIWAVALARPARGTGFRPPAGMLSMLPAGALRLPRIAAEALPPLRFTDRGWTGEPTDPDAPNEHWPARLLEPPAIERGIPIYPTEARRAQINAGELLLANGDGALDALAGDWRLSSRVVEILRGPYRRPRRAARAEFSLVGRMRIASVAAGTAALRIPLGSVAADLTMAASPTYAGTGGAEGTATMAGQNKPLRYGFHRNATGVMVDPGLQLMQWHAGRVEAFLAFRASGAPMTVVGDYPTREALAALVLTAGQVATCRAQGLTRHGGAVTMLTADFRGASPADTGYLGTAASIAAHLIRVQGGQLAEMASAEGFLAWPAGEVGLDATGLTVAEAVERLAASVGGWWQGDLFGRFRGGMLARPEDGTPSLALEPWMLAAPPEETGDVQPPWHRVRVAYGVLGATQSGDQLAGVSEADRAFYGQPQQIVTALSEASQRLPGAIDGPLVVSAFALQADGQAMADRLLAQHGVPRRGWSVRVRRDQAWRMWGLAEPGVAIRLTWPRIAALAEGRPMLIRDVSAQGDDLTLRLWG